MGLADYDGNIVTHEFPLRSLAEYLEPDEDFDIQTADLPSADFPCWRNGTSSRR